MNQALKRFLAKSGIVLALLGLATFFSIATLSSQVPDGVEAAPLIAREVLTHHPVGASVLIVLSQTPQDRALAPELEKAITTAGLRLLGAVAGDPSDARNRIAQLNTASTPVDAFACSGTTSTWRLLSDAPTDFSSIGKPRIHTAPAIQNSAFLKPSNLLNIANQIAVIAIVAVGMTMVIIVGGIDLSVGSLIALSAVIATRLIRDCGGATGASGLTMVLCSLAGIASTGVVGALTGGAITRFRVPPFIATLSTMLVASGAAFILADGQSIHEIPERFVALGRNSGLFGIPHAVLLVAVLYSVGHILMTRRRIGRHLYAVGGNAEAARLAGVPVQRVTLFAYVVSGLLAGLGGVVMASQLKSGSPTYGNMYELYVIAAVVVGGTSLRGGEGSIIGTLLGTLTIAVIQNGMNLLNVESYTQKVILGLVILAAVLLDTRRQRRG
jgi:ribose transport system permease protein